MKNKKLQLLLLIIPLVLILSGCQQTDIHGSGIWNTFVIFFAKVIVFFAGLVASNIGMGIIITTIVIRIIMIPLYKKQNESTMQMQVIQPKINKLNKKYENRTAPEDKQKKNQELQALYKEAGVNPLSGCLPLLLQLPILFAFYAAIEYLIPSQAAIDAAKDSGTQVINGLQQLHAENFVTTFLGLDLNNPVIIFAVLAAVSSYFVTIVSQIGTDPTAPGSSTMKYMKFVMPAMVFFFGITLPGALSVYWIVSNALTILQTLYFKRSHLQTARQQKKLNKGK